MKPFENEDKTLDATPYLVCDFCGKESHNEQITFLEKSKLPQELVVSGPEIPSDRTVYYMCENEMECIARMLTNTFEGRLPNHE